MTAAAKDAAATSATDASTKIAAQRVGQTAATAAGAAADAGAGAGAAVDAGAGAGAGGAGAASAVVDAQIDKALKRFRVVAYVVGVGLITLVFVGIPLRYGAGIPEVSKTISPVHGLMYMIYLGLTVDLARKCKFSTKRTLAIMLAGTIPFLSFVAERRVSRLVHPTA